jgi:hypothetical protein
MSRTAAAFTCALAAVSIGASGQPAPQAAPPGTPAAAATPSTPSPAEVAAERAKFAAEVRKQIAGKEQQPAETVFRNIQVMKGMPAERLVRVMEMGFGPALGVSCTHCHVPPMWESDEEPAKKIARQMMAMTHAINDQYLKKIEGLKGPNPTVNCTTCHRGQVKPATSLGPPAPGR